MKFIIVYVIVLLALFTNEVLSKDPRIKGSSIKGGKDPRIKGLSIKGGKDPRIKDPSIIGGKDPRIKDPSIIEGKDPRIKDPKIKDPGPIIKDPKIKDPDPIIKDPKIIDPNPGFCNNKTLTGGKQIKEGSCSTTIQGDIPASNKMTSSFIISPDNEAVLEPDTSFDVEVVIDNLETGLFSDPESQYYLDPQTLTNDGLVKGHSHVTIQKLDGLSPPDAENFEFFKGLNEKADKGHLVAKVVRDNGTPGLSAGKYRICTMSSAFTHQPLLMPVAKRGSQDDCIRITVEGNVDKEEGKKEEGNGGKKD